MATNSFYCISVVPVDQWQSSTMLVGKIRFDQLWRVHKKTERRPSASDPYATVRAMGSQGATRLGNDEYQRQLDPKRLGKIRDYVASIFSHARDERAYGVFPSSLILSVREHDDYDPELLPAGADEFYSQELSACLLTSDKRTLFVPRNEHLCLIVDGQHRFFGVKQFRDSLSAEQDKLEVDMLEFPATFLVDYDIYQVGEVFAKVNFEQKPVNRSLYYDIIGSLPDEEYSDVRLAHNLALYLNNSTNSPLGGMIKLLGSGYGLVSQAFVADKIVELLRPGRVWYPIACDFRKAGRTDRELADFVSSYFRAIQNCYGQVWPRKVNRGGVQVYSSYKQPTILLKSTGFGALMRLIADIFKKLGGLESLSSDQTKAIERILERLKPKDVERLFSSSGDYAGTGGEGLQERLYTELKSLLQL